MTPTLIQSTAMLDAGALTLLAGSSGPCITILIPAHRPGTKEGSRQDRIRSAVKQTATRLRVSRLSAQAAELAGPLEDLAMQRAYAAGGPGLAIFRSPELVACYAHRLDSENVIIASHFHLTPLLEEALAPQDFFVLGLGKRHLRLLRYSQGECRDIPLPAAVPASLDAALGFDQPDHNLQNRSAVGSSTGDMRAAPFGTLSDREAAGEHLRHFFGLVDRGVKATLDGRPLLLAGVHEDIAAYRRATAYEKVLGPEIQGSVEFLPVEEIAARAAEAARQHYRCAGEQALARYQEMPDRRRALTGVRRVLRAAAEGKVHQLCVAAGAEVAGRMTRALDLAHRRSEDLLNAAVAETLRHRGEVFVVPADRLGAANPLAAILRY